MSNASSPRAGPSNSVREPGKPGRLARTREACAACHKAKQRCDGPSVCPCHRCKTWGIDCVFPSAAGPTPSKSTLGKQSKAKANATATRQASVTPSVVPSPSPKVEVVALPTTPNVIQTAPEVVDALRIMTARLESIEATLSRAQVTFPPSQLPPPNIAPSHSGRTASDHSPVSGHVATEYKNTGSNPVEAAGEAMAIEGLVTLSEDNGGRALDAWDSVKPDVLGRSLMTLPEVEAEFAIYFTHIQPWTALLSTTLDSNPLIIRERSPLLFHAILLLAMYYRPRTPENLSLYRAISSILDSILAPQILCPQPDHLSPDFVRALHLLLLYKPLPLGMFNARGTHELSIIEHSTKMNVRASWILRLLVSRVSAFIGLPSITTTFARAFSNKHVLPVSDEVISQQRLYFGCVFHESHGALQSGKPSNFIPSEALKTTRLFASLRRQASDVRLAASVELEATAATVLATKKDGDMIDQVDLDRFDEEMNSWSEYWSPILSTEHEDKLAWTTIWPYKAFIQLVVHGFAFSRWKSEKKDLAANLISAPDLTKQDRTSIEKAIKASEEILLVVSVEGKSGGGALGLGGGKVAEPGWRGVGERLTVDPGMVHSLRWASDSLTCVMYSYPLIFLAKLAKEGLLNPDLTLSPDRQTPYQPTPLSPNDKLCRLLQLGADLLDAIAPNPHHPAIKQAAFLRRIRDAGISGRRSVVSAPGSPRAGALSQPQLPTRLDYSNLGTNGHHHHQQQHHRDPTLSSYTDFPLSSSYEPSPLHSPHTTNLVNGAHQQQQLQQQQQLAMDDPFSALLNGVSPSMFEGGQSFFGFDLGLDGVDWDGWKGSANGGENGGTKSFFPGGEF